MNLSARHHRSWWGGFRLAVFILFLGAATSAFPSSPECPVIRKRPFRGLGYRPADFSCVEEYICISNSRIHLTHYAARLLELYLGKFGEDIQRLKIDSIRDDHQFSVCLASGIEIVGRHTLNSCTARIDADDLHLKEDGDCMLEPRSIAAPFPFGGAPPTAFSRTAGTACVKSVHAVLDQRRVEFILRSMAEEPSICTGAKTKDRSGIHSLQINEYDYVSCSEMEVQKDFSILDYLCASFFFEDDSIMYCSQYYCPGK